MALHKSDASSKKSNRGRLRFRWLFEPRDLYVGVYREPGALYVMLLPTLGFVIEDRTVMHARRRCAQYLKHTLANGLAMIGYMRGEVPPPRGAPEIRLKGMAVRAAQRVQETFKAAYVVATELERRL